ncbi:hypothetical protein [Streptomyces sp. NPDC023838]|uniref:hypothetical protein n=1 Tax=Streptomyces sp. NPDC023838 TaxID=3154325 RepID=UPI0033EA70C6
MPPQNAGQHARVAADAVERLVRDVRTGRAAWAHPHTVGQGVDDLARMCDALATAVQQLAAALGQTDLRRPPGPPPAGPLLLSGQALTTAAGQLRQARRTLH